MVHDTSLSRRAAIAAGIAAGLGLGMSRGAFAQAQKFRLGAVLPETGVYSQIGPYLKDALLTAVLEVNKRGGINGRQVELVIRDDGSTPGRALLAAKELISEQKIDFLYPEGVSGLVLSIIPYTGEQKMMTISNGSSPQIGDATKFPYSFQYGDLALKRVPAMAAAIRKMGGTKVGIIVSTNPATLALGERAAADMKPKYGLEMVGFRQFATDVKDLTSQLQSLRDAGADILIFDGAAKDNIRVLMSGMQTLGWKAKILTEPGGFSGDLTEQMPKEVANQFYAINYRVATDVGEKNPRVAAFIELHKTYGPIRNLPFAATTRDVVFLVKWAFETAQQRYKATDGDTLRKVLEQIGTIGYPEDYSLVLGNPRYSATDHTTNAADDSKMWALMGVASPVDGIYKGEVLNLK